MVKKKKFGISKNLTESLSQTIQIANQNIGAMRFEVVPISRIELDPENPRDLTISKEDIITGLSVTDQQYQTKSAELNSLHSLSQSINSQGVLNPVWIYKRGVNYRLIMGERRVLASLLAKKTDIPAKVLEDRPVTTELRILQWIENLERSDLSLWERVSNIKMIIDAKILENPEITVNATLLKNIIGCSLPHAMNYLSVIRGNSKLHTFIANGKINNLEKAALLSNMQDNTEFDDLLSESIDGLSLRELKLKVKELHLNKIAHINTYKLPQVSVTKSISLGSCNNAAAIKQLVDSLYSADLFLKQLKCFDKVIWKDTKSVSKAFKMFIASLEDNCNAKV